MGKIEMLGEQVLIFSGQLISETSVIERLARLI